MIRESARSVGVFGGTFDPIHVGHLILAEYACENLGLDELLFVPALIPPHKRGGLQISAGVHRANMVSLAITGNPAFACFGYELEHNRVSYTVETLRHLCAARPESHLWLLIGADNLENFPSWHLPGEILELARLAVWDRPESPPPVTGIPHRRIPAPLLGISGTELRQRVAAGKSIRYMTPDPVIDYIEKHGLYR